MPRDERGFLVPKSFVNNKKIGRRETIIGGASVAAVAIVFAAISKPSNAEKAWDFLFGEDDSSSSEEIKFDPHFISPHLGYTLENNFNWTTGSDILGDGTPLDFFIMDPNRVETEALSPQITITATPVAASMTASGFATIWSAELYKLQEAEANTPAPQFRNGPQIEDQDSTTTTTDIRDLKFHSTFFIKNNIAYAFNYVSNKDEYAAKDENDITNFSKMSQMRSSLRITGAPDFPKSPLANIT